MGTLERHNACKYLTIKIGNVFGAMGLAGNIVNESGAQFIPNRMEMSWKKKTGWNDGWENGIYHDDLNTITPAINNGTYRNYRIDGDGTRRLATFKNDNCRDAFANDYIGYGLCQWTWNSRKYALYDFCEKWAKEHNKPFDIGDLEMQIDFIMHELQTSQKATYGVLMTCCDIITASNFVCIYYERPQGYNTTSVQKTRYLSGQSLFREVFNEKATQWFQYSDKWYYMENGIVKYDKWVVHNGEWYHMGNNGAMETNKWLLYDNQWYYVGSDGACVKDTYVTWNNKDYYINKDGVMEE